MDIYHFLGISIRSCYSALNEFICAVIKTFDIILPVGEELEKFYNRFNPLSGDYDVPSDPTRPIPMAGCVGCLDGFLALILF